jgi:branched-chain amino acid aminotransferase
MSNQPSSRIIWLDGQLLPSDKALVSVDNRGLLLGEGVFETLRAYRGETFAVTRHWDRLHRGCEKLCLLFPTRDVFKEAVRNTLEINRLLEARVRITLTRGDVSSGTQTMTVSAVPAPVWPETETVVTAPWTRNQNSPLAGIKSTSYAENLLVQSYAKEHGAGEALLSNALGNLCEGTGSNVFFVLDGKLFTPPLTSGCLPGVTRELVIHLCSIEQIEVCEEDAPMAALRDASEIFLTSSTREIHPVSRLDGTNCSTVPGPLTRKIAEMYRELTRVHMDP